MPLSSKENKTKNKAHYQLSREITVEPKLDVLLDPVPFIRVRTRSATSWLLGLPVPRPGAPGSPGGPGGPEIYLLTSSPLQNEQNTS